MIFISALDDLILQIPDENLRGRIQSEVANLKKTKKFGLVFENQNPECTPLYNVPVKVNSLVALKAGKLNEMFRVVAVDDEKVSCIRDDKIFTFDLNELITVAQFGDPIYPYLQSIDAVCNAPDSKLWHTLIEADNYHALQLLKYLYAGKVDCIYIDPPYNTGARDWKYNNDYVDASDHFRSSKWLSMMQNRLKLARDILSDSGAIFISIDDHEQATLKLLCDEIFGRKNFVSVISNTNNPKGRSFDKFIATAHEYILVYAKNMDQLKLKGFKPSEIITKRYNKIDEIGQKYREIDLRKTGDHDLRVDRPNLFYYFYYNETTKDFFPDTEDKILIGYTQIKPIRADGKEGCWRWSIEKTKTNLPALIPKFMPARKIWGVMEKDYLNERDYIKPTSSWVFKDVNSERGTELFQKYLGFKKKDFPNPKPVGTIKRILEIATNKNSLIVDFFAGSGTTLHAVNLLNAQDGGNRRCILVTNNEVSDAEEKNLRRAGYTPNDDEWQKLGIARYVTWQRTVCSIEGHNIDGEPLKGKYLDTEIEMKDGFKANAAYFKLGFLNKDYVAMGKNFKEILPVLWFQAGCRGKCPTLSDEKDLPPMLILRENNFAVLLDDSYYSEFEQAVNLAPEIDTIFISSKLNYGYQRIVSNFKDKVAYNLYRDYLENFRIGG